MIKPISLEDARATVAQFAERLSESSAQIKKRYLQAVVGQVVVDAEQIVIVGASSDPAEAIQRAKVGDSPLDDAVRVFDRDWWAQQDSNLRPAD